LDEVLFIFALAFPPDFFGWINKEKQNDTFFENIENKKLGKYKNNTLSIKNYH
jgi:hypothetical protein